MGHSNDRHISLARKSARPGPLRGPLSEIFRWICIGYLKCSGWKVEGDWPKHKKMVLIAAPHTSNWDGINMLAAAGFFRIKLRWMGKQELVEGPFGFIVRWFGCVPVDRSSNNDLVEQMREAFTKTDTMILAIPPEGTRSKTKSWKTGFYYIAHKADVPLLITVLDYGTKTIRLSGILIPDGDYDHDLELIKSHYKGVYGKLGGLYTINEQ